MCSQDSEFGETHPIIIVLQFPTKESLRTMVNLEPRNGKCLLSRSIALIHSFKDNKDLLISAPSILVYLF